MKKNKMKGNENPKYKNEKKRKAQKAKTKAHERPKSQK